MRKVSENDKPKRQANIGTSEVKMVLFGLCDICVKP